MVCLGNICRSPLAQGILESKLPEDRFFIDSAGTGHWHVGRQPDERSIRTAHKHGIDITHQRGQLFTAETFSNFDYIFVMDQSNYDDVIALATSEKDKAKVQMILDDLFPGENVDVPDPYYGLQNGFDMVYDMLDECCDIIAKRLLEKHP